MKRLKNTYWSLRDSFDHWFWRYKDDLFLIAILVLGMLFVSWIIGSGGGGRGELHP